MTRIALYCAERSRPDAEAISDRIEALAPDMSVAVETFEACAGRNAIETGAARIALLVDRAAAADPTFVDIADAAASHRPLFIAIDEPFAPLGHGGDVLDLRVWRGAPRLTDQRLRAVADWARRGPGALERFARRRFVLGYEASRAERTQMRAALAEAGPTLAAGPALLAPLVLVVSTAFLFGLSAEGAPRLAWPYAVMSALSEAALPVALVLLGLLVMERLHFASQRTAAFSRFEPRRAFRGFLVRIGVAGAATAAFVGGFAVIDYTLYPDDPGRAALRHWTAYIVEVVLAFLGFVVVISLGVVISRAPGMVLAWAMRDRMAFARLADIPR